LRLEGGETAKTRPPETARWFQQTATDIEVNLAQAERQIGNHHSKEFDSTLVDLKILAQLAIFHAQRIPAAVSYCLFQRTQNPTALADAIAGERKAIAAWRQLVNAAGDVYANDLAMGTRGAQLCGHWRDELNALEKGLNTLEQIHPTGDPKPLPQNIPPTLGTITIRHHPITNASTGQPLTITATAKASTGIKWVQLRYRSVNQHLDYQTLPMLPTSAHDQYQAVVPAAQIDTKWDFMYFIEAMDKQGIGKIHPDLNRETPYVVVPLTR
jgi:hypothetical protein